LHSAAVDANVCSVMVMDVLMSRLELVVAVGDRRTLLRAPVALAPEPGGPDRVGACSPAAEAQGVQPGITLAEALARSPQLVLVPPDPVAVDRSWEALLVALEGIGAAPEPLAPGEACFDVSGLRRMYRGLDGVIAATRRAVGWPGLRIGLGPVRFCSEAAARRAGPRRASQVHGATDLAPMPVDLLACRERTAKLPHSMRRFGLSTLGDLVRIGRGPLGERFGASGILAHDLASGIDSPLIPRVPGSDLVERFDLPESLSGELLDRVLGLLLDRLLARREREGRTLRTVVLEAALVEGGTWRTRVVLREATADRVRLQLALAPHLAQLSAPAQSLGVLAESFGGPPSQALPLLEDDAERRKARLREGLRQVSAGSGEDALLRVVEVDPASRLPERRMALAPREL
jgi:protein ImuB